LTIGDLTVETQDFAEATRGSDIAFWQFDGTFGLGFDIAAVNGMVPPFYHMLEQALLDEPIFTFYFGDSTNDEDGEAEITFSGVNDSHFIGKMFHLPLRRNGTWELDFDAIIFGNETFPLSGAGVSLDTRTSLIAIPSSLAELL
jgi:saccharopepsin